MSEFKSPIGTVGCYLENVGEFMQEFEENNVTTEGKVDTITVSSALSLMQESLKKYKESKLECEGKTVVIDFGDGPIASVLENLFKSLGFEL